MPKEKNMKIFAYGVRPYDELGYFEKYSKEMGFDFDYTTEYPCPENAHLAEGADGISILTNPTDSHMLDLFKADGAKYIATRSIGYDHIDVEYAKKIGMRVANASYSPNSVANYTIMMMLMACRNICYILDKAKMQDYGLKGKMGRELSESTVGIIGTGKIGQVTIEHLAGFGCKILAYDKYQNEAVKKHAQYVDLETLYRESDIISVHIPGFKENRHMFNKETFAKMKDGVIFVNAARGLLVNSQDLIEALQSGKVGFAALDTFDEEIGMCYVNREGEALKNNAFYTLTAMPNVIFSPHMAFYTEQAVADMVGKSAGAMVAFSRGEQSEQEVL